MPISENAVGYIINIFPTIDKKLGIDVVLKI
jgi:hypothetical protein